MIFDEPTARIRRQDLQVLVQASRLGAMVVVPVPVPVMDVVAERTLPVRPLPPPTTRGPIPVNPVTVIVAFFVSVGIGFAATVPFW